LIPFSAVILGVHFALMQQQPNILTIIVPRHLQQGREIARVSFYPISFENMFFWFNGYLPQEELVTKTV